MELHFFGANCVTIGTKGARVIIDDNLADLGAKSITKADDIVLYTGAHSDPAQSPRLLIDHPGEYELSGVGIYGIPARGHMDEPNQKNATMYKIVIDDFKVLIVGHIYPELSEKQLETIGMVDVMMVPVGGNGFTLDAVGALSLIKKIEPKLVIPTHYNDATLNFPVPQATLEDALKNLAMEPKEKVTKLKLKPSDLSDDMQLIVLEKA